MKTSFENYTFQQWLDYIQQQHPENIDLGLDRIGKVAARLALPSNTSKTVIIGGTNGKGTTLGLIESIALANNKSVFSYSSPHVFKFNERIRLNGKMVSDEILMNSFIQIEKSRKDIELTFFEFTTLSAMLIQSTSNADIALYEVGLGGRLDAVNILQPDLSVITSIALDHTDWLGDTVEQIAFEKLAIGRKDKPLLIADASLSKEILEMAALYSNQCLFLGRDFDGLKGKDSSAILKIRNKQITVTIPQNIHINNLSAAAAAADLLGLELNKELIESVCENIFLPARFEKVLSDPNVYIDVSHNQQAIEVLQQRIALLEKPIHLVCGMLADKLLNEILQSLLQNNYFWHLASLDLPRGATAKQIEELLTDESEIKCYKNIKYAMESAFEDAQGDGSIVVFGSFVTAEQAGAFIKHYSENQPQIVEKTS